MGHIWELVLPHGLGHSEIFSDCELCDLGEGESESHVFALYTQWLLGTLHPQTRI